VNQHVGGKIMFFHVILTTDCNLQCRYCFGETLEDFDKDFTDFEVDYTLPRKVNYDLNLLAKFCSKDPECVLTFYGGEPLLYTDEIKQIMDSANPRHFMIQTNGLLLNKLEPEYINRFHTILVSLDGKADLTDYYRGHGTFQKVIDNLKLIVQNGFRGELIARMTVMEQTDIYEQVKWLVGNDNHPFSSVHWQLNAGFWTNDYARRNFRNWSKDNYIPGLNRLSNFWVDQMEKKKVVLRLYPFLGIANSLLSKEKESLLRCGSGWINYAIQTDGHIIPCPAMWGLKNYYLSHINDAHPLKLRKSFVGAPCTECDILNLCGGRCLYANISKRWSKEAYAEVCFTVLELVNAVKTELPRIKDLIKNGRVGLGDFMFMKYNGCEIIP
jgi:uncharacterized protein